MSNHKLQVSPISQPPPSAGAVDLSALKGAPKKVADEAFNQQLIAAQVLCQCGERIRDEGRLLYIRRDNTVPSPQGGLPGLGPLMVHSLECPHYLAVMADPMLKVVALRRVTEVEWQEEAS
jgi:hypothetical protein